MNQVKQSKLSYRAEIDGLRAIAVVSIILYHAQMVLFGRDWFEGGYIGVDIFFVISGYLITRIILSELQEKGSFSFLSFYERRARRILPMLFVVIFASIPFAWQKLLPTALIEYVHSVVASIFFGSNFLFYFSTTEYGSESALLKPLLHTWSLGVEEQFYLVFPVLAIVAFKFFKKHFLSILVALSVLSLQFAELMEARNSNLNFYLPFSRFWELAIGSMLAYRELNYKPDKEGILSQVLPMAGLYLLAYSILFFDGKMPHPGFITIIPVLGVALIIAFASKDELVGKVLGSKPFVWIGLISYSAYLWHFPIFAFSRNSSSESGNYDKLELIVLALFLSVASYFFIERPFRNRRLISTKVFSLVLLASLVGSLTFTYLVINNEGYTQRFPELAGFENHELDNEKLRKDSWTLLKERNKQNPNFQNVDYKILLIGNSHSKDTFNALDQNRDMVPNFDFLRSDVPQLNCLIDSIKDYEAVRQGFYQHRNYLDSTAIVVSTRYDTNQLCESRKKNTQKSSDFEGLKDLVKRARSDGKVVLVMGNSAEFQKLDEKWTADYIFNKYKNDILFDGDFEKIRTEADQLFFAQLIPASIKHNKNIKVIAEEHKAYYFDKIPLVCDLVNERCTAFTDDGYKTFYDASHWTLEGAKYFGKKLLNEEFFEKLK